MTTQETKEETFFNEKIVFPNIEHLEISSIKIRKMWDSKFSSFYSCTRNLVTLMLYGCKFIKDIFTVSMVNSLVQLQWFEIRNCPRLQEIIIPEKHGETNKICLPKLEYLALQQLDSLGMVCTSDLIECPKLKYLRIDDCPQLKTFITSSSPQLSGESLFDNKVLFPNLGGMIVSGMDSLIMLWDEELHEDSFTKLKVLRVHNLRSLTKLFSSNMLRKVHILESLTLTDCDSLEEVFDLRGLIKERGKYPERISMLADMTLHTLPNLKHVWRGDPHGIHSFLNLRLLDFYECSSLQSLIPASVSQQLKQLEEIKLNECSNLEHIIYNEEEIYQQQDVEATFTFPSLTQIRIWNAPMLSNFYPGKHIIDWSSLQHASIIACPMLEVFKSERVPEEAQSGQSSISQPLFSFEQVVAKLESVSLNNQELQMIQKRELPDVLSSTLKVVEFYDLKGESANLPITFMERFPNLEKLEVGNCDFVELFTCEILDEAKEKMSLSRIQHLNLQQLNAFENIWNLQSELDRILNNLLTLYVRNCESIIHLAPPSASFCNLTTLYVGICKSLASLFTFSTMASLVQLSEMTIYDCPELTEIVAVSDEKIQRETQICLYKLQILTLSELGSITSFCSQSNAALMFPLLVQLTVNDCPHMEFFSRGYLSVPKLKAVKLKWGEDNNESRWKGDLNTTIRQLYTENRLAAEEEANTIKDEEEILET